ncbi:MULTISPECIES: hypothetical protein [unclassified Butyricicoccus]
MCPACAGDGPYAGCLA